MKITNLITGEKVRCIIEKASREDIVKSMQHFVFDWLGEFRKAEVYKLTTGENPGIVQAFFSMNITDRYVYMSLLERSNFRGIKVYEGITEIAFAVACNRSFEEGYDGFVSFQPKTKLMAYYQKILGAASIGSSQRMYIDRYAAKKLVALLDD